MNHVKDVRLEPNPKTVYGGLFLKMEGSLEYMPEQEMLTKRVSSNVTEPPNLYKIKYGCPRLTR